jgi:hypothetical protein
VPMVTCPQCSYRMPVRSANLDEWAQCLRCVHRFVPRPPETARPAGRTLARSAAVCTGVAAALVAAVWLMVR